MQLVILYCLSIPILIFASQVFASNFDRQILDIHQIQKLKDIFNITNNDITQFTNGIDKEQMLKILQNMNYTQINSISDLNKILNSSYIDELIINNKDSMFNISKSIINQNKLCNNQTTDIVNCQQPINNTISCSLEPELINKEENIYITNTTSCGANCLRYIHTINLPATDNRCNIRFIKESFNYPTNKKVKQVQISQINHSSNIKSIKINNIKINNNINSCNNNNTISKDIKYNLDNNINNNQINAVVSYYSNRNAKIEFLIDYIYESNGDKFYIDWKLGFCDNYKEKLNTEIECIEPIEVIDNSLTINNIKYNLDNNTIYPYFNESHKFCKQVNFTHSIPTSINNTCKDKLLNYNTCDLKEQNPIIKNKITIGNDLLYHCSSSKTKCIEKPYNLFKDCNNKLSWQTNKNIINYNEINNCTHSENNLINNCPSFILRERNNKNTNFISNNNKCTIISNESLDDKLNKFNIDYKCETNKESKFDEIIINSNCNNISTPIEFKTSSLEQAIARISVISALSHDNNCNGLDCNIFSGKLYNCRQNFNSLIDCCNQQTEVNLNNYLNLIFNVTQMNNIFNNNELINNSFGIDNLNKQATTSSLDSLLNNNTYSEISTDLTKQEILQESTNKIALWIEDNFGKSTKELLFNQIKDGTGYVLKESINNIYSSLMGAYSIYNLSISIIKEVYKCSNQELEFNTKKDLKSCHHIGSYCNDKVLGSCIEQQQTYCCFNSPISRIINQQANKQLNMSWGDPDNPQCSNLKVKHLSEIDWQKINLDEWISILQDGDFIKQIKEQIEKNQETINESIKLNQQRMKALIKK